MTAEHLTKRDTEWVGKARVVGDNGETTFVIELLDRLPGYYHIEPKPKKIKLFTGGKGIRLDTKITNTLTGEVLFVEKKTGNNGGNAHERVYKYISPALKRRVSEMYNTPANPFFLVFSGKTFQKQKYREECELLLEGEEYAIIEEGFKNMDAIADQIMEII